MMLQVLHKIIALILALVILFSTLSFTVEKHICMGEVTDVSYFSKVDSCGMTADDCALENSSDTKIHREKCCNDVHELIPGSQNEQQALQKLEISQVELILSHTYCYSLLFESKKENTFFNYYLPPLVDYDIQILYQTFLI